MSDIQNEVVVFYTNKQKSLEDLAPSGFWLKLYKHLGIKGESEEIYPVFNNTWKDCINTAFKHFKDKYNSEPHRYIITIHCSN